MPFAAYPSVFIREAPNGKKAKHLIWGDFVKLLGDEDGDWVAVRSRGENGWLRKDELQEEQLLEVSFVDIGQGDGCFIVTPDDQFLVIDAGERDNMFRFLRWRFNLRNHPDRRINFRAAVISHPDADHYKGFTQLFKSPNFTFKTVYHNGIVERAGDRLLGPEEVGADGRKYLTDVITDGQELGAILNDPGLVGEKLYPNLLKSAADGGRVGDIRMISARDGFLPGFESGQDLSIRVLAPVPEDGPDGKPRLRVLGKEGVTKNGHSVVLKLRYRDVSILLGGDLNIPAEHYLLQHYTGVDPKGLPPEQREALIAEARKTFEVDIAKACHHGSADFTDLYLRAVNPIATIISSGDGEPHCHPRPDALGGYGRAGRGKRPLIFSTELARSSSDSIQHPEVLRQEIQELFDLRERTVDPEDRATVQKKIDQKLAKLERSVAVFGMINVRTDGRQVILAQKLERPRQQTSEEWDIHRLEPGPDGLRYVSKHLEE